MSMYELCLLDCQSIQQYVFGSNKLRTNIGASANVAAIFKKTLQQFLPDNCDITIWHESPGDIRIFGDSSLDCEAGYIGGGNALLIFKMDEKHSLAQEFLNKWSRNLLLKYPGIVPAAAVHELENKNKGDEITKSELDTLFRKLAVEKNKSVPVTVLPRHGITAECKQTGLSAEIFDKEEKRPSQWVSSVSKAKIDAAAEKAKHADRLAFNEEQLGQIEAKNHIAVVHIDGNSMGKQFMDCRNLGERRRLSSAVEKRTDAAWKTVKEKFEKEYDYLWKNKIIKKQFDDNEKVVWPFREIILNGDDLTFICNARLAFWLTELFLQELAAKPLNFKNEKLRDSKDDEIRMSACAGIAFVKTKFPFYRAYNLAEELCGSAKTKGREQKQSWVDFEIVYGGLSGDLEQIREKKYSIGNNTLISRPWRMLDEKGNTANISHEDWACLKKSAREFTSQDEQGKSKWPRSKRKELLLRLARGLESFKDYEVALNARNLHLDFDCGIEPQGWQKLRFYYDTLQVSEFYPDYLLKGGKNG